ncbi:MAG: sulfate ABC transporter ATP-binding protein [Gemmataceae bacterium]|nr:sulfate ABC transporter ATP-binding protein [Gemmataceae bacterium]MCI0742819.1 sulfate ABC transporter ATP-binding protein [Gemmataceae bacterium]
MSILVKDVSKRFGEHTALERVSLEVPSGVLVALLGPSGSGKTTLLRIIAGLEVADEGSVFLHEEDARQLDVRERNIGFVFQHYALFRHMTVHDNIGFALKVRRRPKQEIKTRVRELLRLIQLEGIEYRYPAQLSGGQRQRVALARALCARPRVLLLDEPFGALDARVRKELRDWLRRLHDEIHVTSVFVTHDQEEALELADRVVVMNHARIEQVGTPEEVYHHPANPFVMRFLGQVNLFHGRLEEGQVVADPAGDATPVVGYARPHQLEISRESASGWPARVLRMNAAGIQVRVDLLLTQENRTMEVALSQERFHELALRAGENVFVKPKQLKVFAEATAEDYVI